MLLIVLQTQAFTGMLFPLILLILFYFFFIRPQTKKQKEQVQFNQNMQKGDEVVTGSGIIGQIVKLDSHSVTLQVGEKTYIKILPSAINKEMTEQYRGQPKGE
ncbi:MAG: preprotein translocase subunit YajC [Saprospiraceae bacterium]